MLLDEFENATVAEADFFGRYAEAFSAGGAMSAEAAASDAAPKGGGFAERVLAGSSSAGNRVPNPAILFLGLIVLVIALSQILDWANVGVTSRSPSRRRAASSRRRLDPAYDATGRTRALRGQDGARSRPRGC